MQAPDLGVQQAIKECAQGQALVAPKCRQQHLKHRHHDEQGHQSDDAAQRARYKWVLCDAPAGRQAPGEHPQHAHARHNRAVAHAELALLGLPEPFAQNIEGPALQAKAIALAQHVDQAQQTQPANHFTTYARLQGRQRRCQSQERHADHRGQPEVFTLEKKKQRRCMLRVQRIARQPLETPEAVLQHVPGEKTNARKKNQDQAQCGPVHPDRFHEGKTPNQLLGKEPTSSSHFFSKRLRSADEPYLTKS